MLHHLGGGSLFTLLTWARTNETHLATWDEFEGLDGKDPLWRVPADCMKMHREHLAPLSSQTVALLNDLRSLGGTDYVFPGDKIEKPISQNTMIYGCYRMGYRGRQTVHGFRGLASTWASVTVPETRLGGFGPDVKLLAWLEAADCARSPHG